MARTSTGGVLEKQTTRGKVYALRFRALGDRRYVTLGTASEGWTRKRAEQELANVLADVRRGIWQPPEATQVPEPTREEPTFGVFAREWFEGRKGDGLAERTLEDYRWSLNTHLGPHFGGFRLAAITVEEVDRFRRAKVLESQRRRDAIANGAPLLDADGRVLRPLSPSSVNKTLKHLAGILEEAREYGYLATNPAKGARRRLKAPRTRRAHLDRAEWITALLDAAGDLDRDARLNRDRRPLLATLIFAGLRISEALALRWRDVDLAAGRLRVQTSKTSAGVRYVPLLPTLRDELATHKARARPASDLVFATSAGAARDRNAARTRMLHPAVKRADARLEADGAAPLPEGLTLHGLRHTYVSLRLAVGHDLASVARDAGHADVLVTARVYTHVMALDDGERERLRALVEGADWAPTGTAGSVTLRETIGGESVA